FGLPYEIAQLSVMRLFSASAARGLQLDIFETYGPDSSLGLIASIIMSSTETVFYIMTVYFASIKISNTKYTLKAAVLVNLIGVIVSIFIVRRFF
ncbi:MAG: spore maturation protein, partial [Defluviitaleaceae bacterium]|nr:spore maturation protein [Defluviitaleaceae bacterium]